MVIAPTKTKTGGNPKYTSDKMPKGISKPANASHEIASAAVVECYLHCKIITCLILCMKDKTKKNIVLYENTLPQDARVLFETFEQIDLNLNLVEIL